MSISCASGPTLCANFSVESSGFFGAAPAVFILDSNSSLCFRAWSSFLLKKNQMPRTAAMAHTPSEMPTASPTVRPVCDGAGAGEALLVGVAVVDDVVDEALVVLVEELDVEVELAVVTVAAEGVFSTPAPSSTPMTAPGINPKLPLLQHDVLLFGMSQQYVGCGPSVHSSRPSPPLGKTRRRRRVLASAGLSLVGCQTFLSENLSRIFSFFFFKPRKDALVAYRPCILGDNWYR